MDRRRLVEVGIAPEGGQELLAPGGLAEFQGHPGHDSLIPVAQGLAPQTHQGEHQGQQPDQQQGWGQPKRPGTGTGAHGEEGRFRESARVLGRLHAGEEREPAEDSEAGGAVLT